MPTLHSLLGPHTVRQIAPRYTVKYIGLFALYYTYFKYTCTVYCFFPLTWTLFVFCLHFKHLSFILRFSGQSFDKYIYMWYTKTVHVSERCSQLLFVVFLHKYNREFVGGRDITKVIDKNNKIIGRAAVVWMLPSKSCREPAALQRWQSRYLWSRWARL